MVRGLILAFAFVLTITLTLFGFSYREPRADFIYTNSSDIHTLDPARMSWTQDFRVALNLWEGLTTSDGQTSEPREGAAHFPPDVSADGLIYAFTIRPDARWSNGDVVTARDFVRGWRRGMEPGTATDYTFLFTDHIAGAEEYVRWRRNEVQVLTGLWRQSQGWSMTAEQARAMEGHPFLSKMLAKNNTRFGKTPTTDPNPSRAVRSELGNVNLAPRGRMNVATGEAQSALRTERNPWNPESEKPRPEGADELERADPAPLIRPTTVTLDSSQNQHDRVPPFNWIDLHAAALRAHVAELDRHFEKVGISALDDRTLEVRLRRPCPYFLDLCAFPIFLPCHESIELLRERYAELPLTSEGLVVYDPQWTKPDYRANGYPGLITNGPYQLADWRFKRRARMIVNRHHRAAGSIACSTVEMRVIENMNAALMAYEAGEVDFIPGIEVSYDHEIARLAASGARSDFQACPVLATYFFNFNCSAETIDGRLNPFRDPRVRRAFALATDRRTLVEKVLQRGDVTAATFVPPGALPGYESPAGLPYEPVQARQLLGEAGYPEGRGLPPIDLLHVAADQRVCQALAQMWEQALGVQVELRVKESKTFAEDKAAGRFMVARGNWYADYLDPGTFLDILVTGNGNNDSGYASDRYVELMAAANRAPQRGERMLRLQEAESLAMEQDLPILPILHYVQTLAIAPRVQGLHPNPRLRFSFRDVQIKP